AVAEQDYEKAAMLRDNEAKLRTELSQINTAPAHRTVSEHDISRVIAEWTGIPCSILSQEESERLLNLENELNRAIIGQREAVSAVVRAIRRSRTGLKDPHRPVGSFLFLGPTGVGKTELCRKLSAVMFGREDAMIKLDMSEYMEKHSVSKLIGSPPGYIGHDEGGQLTEKVRRKPYSLILFDEIEKAGDEIFNLLLQIMEDGSLTDSFGRRVDFKNCIIVMTSNIGAADITDGRCQLGFVGADDDPQLYISRRVNAELKRSFKPEFLNRLDETVVFRRLDRDDMLLIAQKLLKEFKQRAEKAGIKLSFSPAAAEFIVNNCRESGYGARPLRRSIQTLVEDPIAEEILKGNLSADCTVHLDIDDGKIVFPSFPN
ncbi:MAG: ATP-dependent Clp protease ATP-binding subunit, partial [Oscillospiraceae bacterium]|nr:ATP-dependent Clp protease ATP-binding subunit [Oscillospiraceae bacterium]